MATAYRIPLTLEPQPEGGYTVTSPVLPELITEGDTLEEALANARDAFSVVLEIYEDCGKQVPSSIIQDLKQGPIHTEQFATA
jgi:antitoxin HicB